MIYRKKPVEVFALKCHELMAAESAGVYCIPKCFFKPYQEGKLRFFNQEYMEIHTLEGTMRAEKDDWIICGVKGEIYPCKPDVFEMTYEPVYETRMAEDDQHL